MMQCQIYQPYPDLVQVIKRVVILRYSIAPGEPLPTNPFPPRPEHCLYFYPYDRVQSFNYADRSRAIAPPVMLVGAQTARVDLTIGRNMLVVIVAFYPGALHRIIRIPMDETLNVPIDASLFLPSTSEMIERLNETVSFDEMNRQVQNYVRDLNLNPKGLSLVDRALNTVLDNGQLVTVDKLADIACLSTRQLERQFLMRVGLSPKQMLRLIRFSNAWLAREQNDNASWIEIAHAFGYADQMHLVKDFKEFAGVNPSIILKDLQVTPLRLQADAFSE